MTVVTLGLSKTCGVFFLFEKGAQRNDKTINPLCAYHLSNRYNSYTMSKPEVEDPRVTELKEINCRLKTVISYLKSKHTPRSIESRISDAEGGLNDHTSAFVPIENTMIEGTRHIGSLFQLCDALEVKAEMGGSGAGALKECSSLLERKVKLLKDIHRI